MRWQRFATSLSPSKLLKGFMALAAIKTCLLIVLLAGQFTTASTTDTGGFPPALTPSIAPAEAFAEDTAEAATTDEMSEDMTEAGMEEEMSEEDASSQWSLIKRKQEELNRREQELLALEQELDAKIAQLTAMQEQLDKMLTEAKEVKDKQLKHLVDVYSNMKPKQAAQVLETLREDIAVKILAGMRGRQAGEILSYVEAKKAARLSEQLTRLQIPFE